MRYLDADAVAALGPAAAVQAVVDALRAGFDPAADPARTAVGLAHGQFLLMPSESATGAGVKVVGIAPGNPARGLPRIQATYLLFDRDTLALRAVLDGAGADHAAHPGRLDRRCTRGAPRSPAATRRDRHRTAGRRSCRHPGRRATAGRHRLSRKGSARTSLAATALGSASADDILRRADVVVCATSAREPVFNSALLADDVVVIAVGSHEPDARELDAHLLGRATVMVEDLDTALREAGDVVLAIAARALSADDLISMREVVTGAVRPPVGRPVVFKSVGMSWQDLVVAEAVLNRSADRV